MIRFLLFVNEIVVDKITVVDNAKLNKSDVYDINVELDYKYGQKVYEIDFNYNQYEYEYYINATNGKIVHHFKEID